MVVVGAAALAFGLARYTLRGMRLLLIVRLPELRHPDLPQQPIDDPVEAIPRRLAVVLVAHDDGAAGVEFLVEHVAAGEFRADEVPGELVELQARQRLDRRRRP